MTSPTLLAKPGVSKGATFLEKSHSKPDFSKPFEARSLSVLFCDIDLISGPSVFQLLDRTAVPSAESYFRRNFFPTELWNRPKRQRF